MTNGTADYDERALTTSDDLIKFGFYVSEQSTKNGLQYNIVQTIRLICGLINGYSSEILDDTADKFSEEIKEDFKGLPIFYHIRVMQQFFNEYYQKVLILQFRDEEEKKEKLQLDRKSLYLTDQLMQSCKDFEEKEGIVPSPFEMIYVYLLHISNNPGKNDFETACSQIFFIDPYYQYVTLKYFLQKYTSTYISKLE